VAIKLEPRDLLLVDSHSAIHANAALIGGNNDRLTIIAYFREDMLRLKSWRYEKLREQFVKECGKRKGMWRSHAWATFLADHNAFDEDGLV
jgi:hypothetical protein